MRNLDKTVSFCFDRFDHAIFLYGLLDLPADVRATWYTRAQRWWKRAHRYDTLRKLAA